MPGQQVTAVRLDLILRPKGMSEQQITRLNQISDKNRSTKRSKTQDHHEKKNEVISSKRKGRSLEIR